MAFFGVCFFLFSHLFCIFCLDNLLKYFPIPVVLSEVRNPVIIDSGLFLHRRLQILRHFQIPIEILLKNWL